MEPTTKTNSPLSLFSLPHLVLNEIFSYLSYDEVARFRVVSRDFNEHGKKFLNKGLLKVEKFHSLCLKEKKIQLPRRESERRVHPLARHVDVLMAIETRISMLSMTYSKYIDSGLTCFIPGKVLDEIFRVLRIVRGSDCPPRPHEILQELRDISSMAMEHFDEKLVPEMRLQLIRGSPSAGLFLKQARSHMLQTGHHHSGLTMRPSPSVAQRSLLTAQEESQHLDAIEANVRRAKLSSTVMRKEIKTLRTAIHRQFRTITAQRTKIAENAAKIAEQGTQLAELRRLIDEYGQKVSGEPPKCHPSTSYDTSEPIERKTKLQPQENHNGPPEKRKRKN